MSRVIYADRSSEFWPTGWLVYWSIALGVFDLAMVANLVRLVVTR